MMLNHRAAPALVSLKLLWSLVKSVLVLAAELNQFLHANSPWSDTVTKSDVMKSWN